MSFNPHLNRRHLLGAGGLAAASALGLGMAGLGTSTAHASPFTNVHHEDHGRIQFYRFTTNSIRWEPRANILLPENYDASRRYPVLYLLHGGGIRQLGANYDYFNSALNIVDLSAGLDLIIVMPDGGGAGWYSNPARVGPGAGPLNWETFHMDELIPWVDATFPTHAEYAGRAVSGFSMGGFGALKYTAKYYGHFASVSSHSGPASLRRDGGIIVAWANLSSALELRSGTVYGDPWDQQRITADNPVENVERYRNKRIFLAAGTARSLFNGKIDPLGPLQEQFVMDGQREFGGLLDAAGISHERHELPGDHFVRPEMLRKDLEGVVAHLKKAS